MRDRFFREDENELPYLVSEKRDDDSRSYGGSGYSNVEAPKSEEEQIDDILKSMDLSFRQWSALRQKLLEFLNSKDCTGLRVEGGFGGYDFIFTRENEYVRTEHKFEYFTELGNLERVFSDCYDTHYHDGLLADSRFQDMVRKTGLEFIGCRGGYVSKYETARDEFTLTDEIDVRVSFRVGSTKRLYKLDLERMELSERYFEFDI
jgi:hypothetical protein